MDVKGSRIVRAKKSAVRVQTSTNIDIIDNIFSDLDQTGIFCGYGCWLLRVNGNEISGTGYRGYGDGLTLVGGGNIMVTNNKILSPGCYGIWSPRLTSKMVFENNVIVGGVTSAMHFNGRHNSHGSVEGVVVGSNIIENNSGHSILFNPLRNSVVKNNIVEGLHARDAVFSYGEFGEKELNSISKENIVFRDVDKYKAQKTFDENQLVVWGAETWPDRIPNGLYIEDFKWYVSRGFEALEPVFVEGIGLEGKGAFLIYKKGDLIPVYKDGEKFDLKAYSILENTPLGSEANANLNARTLKLGDAARVKLLDISGKAFDEAIGGDGLVTFHLESELNTNYRVDIYADGLRVGILPITRKSKEIFFVSSVDKSVKKYEFYIIKPANIEEVSVLNFRAFRGAYPLEISQDIIFKRE